MTSPDDSHREQALTNRASEGAEKSLRGSEDFIRAALNALAPSIAILDGSGVILEVNDAWVQFAKANGYDSPPYGVGVDYLDLLRRAVAAGDQSAQPILDGLTAVLSGGLPQFEYEYPCHSPRERRWFILGARPLPTPHFGAVVSHINITERKKAEESRAQLAAIVTSSADAIYSYDFNGTILSWNRGAEALYGYAAAEVVGQNILLIVPPDLSSEPRKLIAAIKKGETVVNLETASLRKDGSRFDALLTASPIRDATGEPFALSVIVRDVTASKQAATALRESRERLAATYSNAPIGIVETDLDGAYLSVNDEFCRITGYARDELLKLNLRDITHEEDYPRNRGLFERLVAGEFPSFRLEKRYVRKDGSIVRADIHRTLIRDAPGQPLYVIGAVADITERKRAEEQLRESEEKLRLFVEHAPAAVAMFDREMRYLAVSRRWLADYKLAGDVIGLSHYEVFPGISDEWKRIHHNALRGRIEKSDEDRFERADGSVNWLKWEVRPWTDAAGAIGGIIIFSEDISERKEAEEKIRAIENRFRNMADSAAVLIWQTDAGGVTFVNRHYLDFFGVGFDRIAGMGWADFMHPDDADGYVAAYLSAFERQKPYEHQCRFLRHDGQYRWLQNIGTPHLSADGEFLGFIGSSTDVTDIKNSETALRESEEQLRRNHETFFNLVKNTPFGIYIVDADFRLVEISEGSQKVFGSIEPLIGRDFAEILRIVWEEPFASEAIAIFRHTLETGEPYHAYNTTEQRGNKEDVESYDWKIERVTLPDGRFGVVCYFYDLTRQKQVQEALRQSEERFRLASDAAGALVYDVDLTGGRAVVVHGLERVTGYADEEGGLTSEWWHSLIHPDDLPAHLENDERQLNVGGKYLAAYRIHRKDGAWIWVEDTAQVIRDEAGANLQLVGAIVDITARKRADEERERLLREAEEANRLKDEFLATASHELRTPLTAVVGWTRMLRTGNFDDEMTARALETIERNANAQTKLIEDLLDISRIITGKLLLDTQPVEVAPVVSAAVNTVRPAADAKNIEIETTLDAEAGAVLADTNRLQQVVWNLLSNAVKFTPKAGRVSVTLRRVDSQIEISVGDTGEGIEPEFLPYVFDRFRQADGRTTRRHGGLGLGLAIVRNLVELHGGTVRAHSEGRGRGATFSVRLPLLGLYRRVEAQAVPLAQEESEAPDALGIECPPKLDGLRVLVVDDDPDTREMLEAVLSQCAAQVVTVASAAEALREIGRLKPDVLVSDIGMPDEDGYELIKKVREMEAGRDEKATPALALTAYAKAEDRVRALAAGYQVHLSKPVEPAEFALVVANLVGRGGTTG